MKKTDFDAIAASAPLNSVAGSVVSRGTHYSPEVNFADHWHSDTPPPMRPIPEGSLHTCADLPGKKVGRLTVLGLAREYNTKKKAGWVVRCACGDYEIRKAPALRNPENKDDCCRKCRHFEDAKKRYNRLGSKSIEDFLPVPTDGAGK